MDTMQNKTQKSIIKKSAGDTEIETLGKKGTNCDKSKQNIKRQYRTCRTQQISEKQRKTRARRKRNELIHEALEAIKGPGQINRHRNKQIIISMRKESGAIMSDREESLKICTSHSVPKQCPHQKVQ